MDTGVGWVWGCWIGCWATISGQCIGLLGGFLDIFALLVVDIHSHSSLILSEDKRNEIKAAGKANVTNSSLSFNTTVLIINLIHDHTSYAVS